MSTSLFTRFSIAEIERQLLARQEWKPFPPHSDRAAWGKLQQPLLNARRSSYLIGAAEALCGTNYAPVKEKGTLWPELTAIEYMHYIRTGNRTGYEAPYFRRRQHLAILILAECMEGEGKFLDEIANGFWAIGSEPTWCLPAHVPHHEIAGGYDEFPALHRPTVDLFASETGFALAEGLYLLREELEACWPGLCAWVDHLIDERLLAPFEEREDYWWMAGKNNWAPWCCSSVLGAACYTLNDQPRLARLIQKALIIFQRFYDQYHSDGGCDEGTGYWAVSPGALLLALELLHSRTDGKMNFYADPKIQAMGRYLPSMHMAGSWTVNFADCGPHMSVRRAVVYRYGERIQNKTMQNLALLGARNWNTENDVNPLFELRKNCGDVMNMLRELWWMPAEAQVKNEAYAKADWFPALQVGVLRSSGSKKDTGYVLAVKGGHNAENHNHNDVGQFILMLDGEPGIVDAGTGSYTRKSFSDQRYTIWTNRGNRHNLPVINGYEQTNGREQEADDVHFDEANASFSLNAAKLYPEAAGVKTFFRTLRMEPDRHDTVTLEEKYEFLNPGSTIEINFLSPRQVKLRKPGELALSAASGRELLLRFPPADFKVEITEQNFEGDALLHKAWPTGLRCITLTHTAAAMVGNYHLEFAAE